MFKEGLRPSWVEIDLKALDRNIKIIQSRVAEGSEVCGIVKSNAYGHGVLECVKVMQENGIETFGISTLCEAIQLREAGISGKIIMLSLVPEMYVDTVIKYNIITGFTSIDYARALSAEAVKQGAVIEVLGIIDTGMGRIGYQAKDPDTITEILEASTLPGIKVAGILSHFSTADHEDRTYADKQEKRFKHVHDSLIEKGLDLYLCTLANSPATMDRPTSHYDLCRPGGIFYGRYQSGCTRVEGIEPVLSVKANIVQLKNVPEGFSVSYDRSLITERPSTIATLAMGYADGIPRNWWEKGHTIVKGNYAPFAGVICMDQCMLDVTDIPNVHLGDEVVIIGKGGDLQIFAEDVAEGTGTIANDITCGCSVRLPYVYVK